MGYRNYAAGVLGRFISRDPIGFGGSSLNLYAYPTNPVTFVDPSGLEPKGSGWAHPVEILVNDKLRVDKTIRYTLEEATEALNRGEDIICSSAKFAKDAAHGASPDGSAPKGPERHTGDGGQKLQRHYHPQQVQPVEGGLTTVRYGGRNLHVFFSWLGPIGDVLDIPTHIEEAQRWYRGEPVKIPVVYTEDGGGTYFTPFTGFFERRPKYLEKSDCYRSI
jgi:uncharacterized protein RhaS with RHS repeats